MNSDEAERRVRRMMERDWCDAPALRSLLDFHEMNKAIIHDRDREVADLQEQLDGLGKENERLRAKLKWFEDREPLIRQGLKDEACSNGYDCCYDWSIVDKWEAENPTP